MIQRRTLVVMGVLLFAVAIAAQGCGGIRRRLNATTAAARKRQHHSQVQRRHELYRFDFNGGDHNGELAPSEKREAIRSVNKKGWGH